MDRSTRQAALWATVVALPLTALIAVLALNAIDPDEPAAQPSPTAPRPQTTAPVPMPAPTLSARAATVCRALLSRMPATLRDLPQRPVTAGPEQNAAYGDPAVTVACGVPMPSITLTDEVWVFDRVCWHPTNRPDSTVLTTVDREVPVQVTVPREYDSPAQWTIVFADPVIAAVPSLPRIPSGCSG